MSELIELMPFAELQKKETACDCREPSMSWMIFDEKEGPLSCQDCGTLLNYKTCKKCGSEILRFGNSFDDTCADASVTSSGDLVCCRCVSDYEDEENEECDDGDYFENDN